MGFSILGLTIGGLVALALLLVGVFGLFGKRTIGQSIRGVLGMIPIGNPKLWSAILLIIGIAGGGLAFGWGYVSSFSSTASLTGEDVAGVQSAMLDCEFATISTSAVEGDANTTFTADSSDLGHYTAYVDNSTGSGSWSINGTLSCLSNRENIRQGAVADCYIEADSFRSKVSTTDSNTYYIVATSTSKSKVPGFTWQQTAYINDNAVATTTSDRERTKLVFAQDEASQDLGFYFTLPGDTVFNYLRADQDPQDVKIICDGVTVGRITVIKQTDT